MNGGLNLGSRSVERPADAGFTLVGTLDAVDPAFVDGGGLVQPNGAAWSVDWHIGADDRWYFPARESTVRQRRIGAGAVLETSMRIPSGDAIQRVYGVKAPGGEVTVVEIENDSPTPVAVALSIRPYGVERPGTTGPVQVFEDRVTVGERIAVFLPRPASEFDTSETDNLLDRLNARNTLAKRPAAHGADATAVVLYPVPHRTTLRFLVPSDVVQNDPGPLPDADAVARGWSAVVEAGGRFSFPDPGVTDQALAARARLLGEANRLPRRVAELEPGAGRILEALALSGAVGEIMASLGSLAGTFPTKLPGDPVDAAAIVGGVGRAARLADDVAVADALLEPVAQLTYLVEKTKDRAASDEALIGLCRLLIVAGQRETGLKLLDRVSTLAPAEDLPGNLDALSALSEKASPAGSWGADEPVAAARFWLGARRLILGGDPRRLLLLPQFPSAWLGGDVEVHNGATTHGLISFAIRWHGYRPALLWELETDGPIEIRCPGLDPDWVTNEASGETLLAGTPDGLQAPPTEGESFA